MAEPVLDFLTYEPRFVKINGTPYRLRHPLELTPVEYFHLAKKSDEIQKVAQADLETITEASVAEMVATLDEFVLAALEAPREIVDRLLLQQKLAVLSVFTAPVPASPSPNPETERTAVPSIGPH
jgi:hypothetical protein